MEYSNMESHTTFPQYVNKQTSIPNNHKNNIHKSEMNRQRFLFLNMKP